MRKIVHPDHLVAPAFSILYGPGNEVPLGPPAPRVMCVASGFSGSHPSTQFARITLNAVLLDLKPGGSGGGFNPVNSLYTAPLSGTYQLTSKLRINDNAVGSNQSYGQGVNRVPEDGSWFQWFVGTSGGSSNRNGSLNQRLLFLSAGETIEMYAYFDGFSASYTAEINIVLLAAS